MSQQINLYDPALLKKRELLTAANLAVVSLLLLVAMGGWGASARVRLAALDGENQTVIPQVKTLQDQIVAIGKQLAEAKPDPRIEADLAATRALLALRGDVVAALKKGIGGDAVSFAEYLRGFARQTPNGLWLTGFIIADDGASMEIRGRMNDPALLPEYIRRLNSEKAFQGRAFAALKVSVGHAAPSATETPATGQAASPATAAGSAPAATTAAPAPYHEFTLIPVAAADAPVKLASAPPTDIVPTEAGRALAEAGRRTLEEKR